ncbi:SMP-30/gluconolactonase/LRE family protein [Promicromonospora sp. Populi]|uniref:SMP-30/gluconolactonase/LRE family protein n=1 Tax=Promicromonospora sp. Populi TaxID=3239420 RepID=UPI0034E2C0F6
MAERMHVVRLTESVATHGEGPAWAPGWAGPRFVDMLRGDVLELRPDGGVDRRNVDASVAALVRPRRAGGWVVATRHGLAYADADDLHAPLRPGPQLWSDEDVRANEGACAPDGALFLGSMAWDGAARRGSVVRVAPDGGRATVIEDVTISNGLGWTETGESAFYVDTATGTIDVFDWSPASGLARRRPWARVDEGGADGLAVDTQNGVWVALFGRGRVHRYDSDGRLDAVIETPVRQPTALAFVGEERDRLICTTSRYALVDPEPDAGAVFEIIGHGARGARVHAFAG